MNSASRLSDRSKLAISIAIVLATVCMLFLAAEVGIRVRQYLKYGHGVSFESIYELDRSINLRVPRAGVDRGRIRINSLGFRGPELPLVKPEGTARIAFLGASTTFCAEASSNEAVWPHLVAESLRERFEKKAIDYVNGGVPGYTVASSIRNLEHRVARLRPDIIVIYHGTNDLSGELRDLAAATGLIQRVSPPESSWLSRYSLLWNLVTKNLTVLAAQRRLDVGDAPTVPFDPEKIGDGFRADLTALARMAGRTGAEVALVTFATHMRPGQTQDAANRAMASAVLYMPGFDHSALVAAYERYNRIIREVARAEGLLLIDSEHSIPGDPAHFVDSVHFSDAGNKAQAKRVLEALASEPRIQQRLAAP